MANGHSLYFRLADGRYVRVLDAVESRGVMAARYQSMLLDNLHLGACLRPVRSRDLHAKMVVGPQARDFTSESDVMKHWEAEQDFLVRSPMTNRGQHVNKRDVLKFGTALTGNCVLVFYDSLSKICVIPLPKEG